MQVSDIFQILAVIVEAFVAVIGVLIAVKKKRCAGWFIAATFALFVIFDLARIIQPGLPDAVLSFVLLVASICMAYAAWLLWKE